MNRLRLYNRGTLASEGESVSSEIALPNTNMEQVYTLDGLGNWSAYGAREVCSRIEIRKAIGDLDQQAKFKFSCDPWRLPPTYERWEPVTEPIVRLPLVIERLANERIIAQRSYLRRNKCSNSVCVSFRPNQFLVTGR